MSFPLVRHGREIVFQPQLFARQYEQLIVFCRHGLGVSLLSTSTYPDLPLNRG